MHAPAADMPRSNGQAPATRFAWPALSWRRVALHASQAIALVIVVGGLAWQGRQEAPPRVGAAPAPRPRAALLAELAHGCVGADPCRVCKTCVTCARCRDRKHTCGACKGKKPAPRPPVLPPALTMWR